MVGNGRGGGGWGGEDCEEGEHQKASVLQSTWSFLCFCHKIFPELLTKAPPSLPYHLPYICPWYYEMAVYITCFTFE